MISFKISHHHHPLLQQCNVSMGVAQPQASIALSTPLFTNSTTTTTTTTTTPQVNVNISDAEVGASGVSFGDAFTPVSPLRQDDQNTVFVNNQDNLEDFHYSPFNVQQFCNVPKYQE